MRGIKCVIAVLLVLAFFEAPLAPALAVPVQEGLNTDNVLRATVYVMQVYTNTLGQAVISCVGSGSLVSADGLILTNAHNALPGDTCKSDRLVIGLSVRLGEAPVATYNAQEVETNVGWDLAVLRITSTLDGRPVDRTTLSLPFVEIGDSDSTNLDQTINVVGFVASQDKASTISQIARGIISGYTAESRIGDRAWIKTNAAIPGGMSGGGAYDTDGKLIGIPTIEPLRNGGSALDCRRVQDSNGDGRVDENDTCIPVSGFIDSLRPARLARGLVLAAALDLTPQIKPPTQQEAVSSDPPAFSRLFFASGVNPAGMPTTVVTQMPAGTNHLYLFFDYKNMRDGLAYELRTTLDSVPNPTFSLSPATWSGGREGLWYIGSTAQAWPNGTYDFALFIDGVRAAEKQIVVGGPSQPESTFSDILFGIQDTGALGTTPLVNTGNVLPVGNTINAEYVYNNMAAGQAWREVWYYQDLKVSETTGTWKEAANGKTTVSASANSTPLQPGRYRLEMYIGDRLAATSDFIMAGGQTALKTEMFSKVGFATELKDNQPGGIVGTTFANSLQHLFATFDWHELGVGIPWTWRWSVDDNVLFEVTQPWGDAPDGSTSWLRLDSAGRIPDGSYKIELLVGGVVMGTATAKIGLGQLPVTTFGVATGVQVQGRITDAETGAPIPGVTFIMLKTTLLASEFTWDKSQVYDLSFTDADGQFTLFKLLAIDKNGYSVVIIAQGFLPISTDGITITDKTKSPMIFNIQMNRD